MHIPLTSMFIYTLLTTALLSPPLSHSSYIDSGRNPELFTRHQLEQTLSDYEAVQSKVQAYKAIYI